VLRCCYTILEVDAQLPFEILDIDEKAPEWLDNLLVDLKSPA
jgi:hypothetical protein